jgi:hypothetical protein
MSLHKSPVLHNNGYKPVLFVHFILWLRARIYAAIHSCRGDAGSIHRLSTSRLQFNFSYVTILTRRFRLHSGITIHSGEVFTLPSVRWEQIRVRTLVRLSFKSCTWFGTVVKLGTVCWNRLFLGTMHMFLVIFCVIGLPLRVDKRSSRI